MQSIFDAITEWLKGLLVEGIMGNLGDLFSSVNEQVGEIASQVTTCTTSTLGSSSNGFSRPSLL